MSTGCRKGLLKERSKEEIIVTLKIGREEGSSSGTGENVVSHLITKT